MYVCMYWLHRVFLAARGLSPVAASGGYSSLRCTGFSLRWPPLLRSTRSRRTGFSSCGTRAQQLWLAGSRAQAQQLWRTGPAAPRHVGSSRTRARTRVPCIGGRIPNHCAIREALFGLFLIIPLTYCLYIRDIYFCMLLPLPTTTLLSSIICNNFKVDSHDYIYVNKLSSAIMIITLLF